MHFNKKQFSYVFSLEHVFSKDETKNSRIARSLGTAVFLLCNRKISYVFSSCFSVALSFAEEWKKGGRKRKERSRLERNASLAFYPRFTRLIQGNATFRNGGKGFCYSWQVFRRLLIRTIAFCERCVDLDERSQWNQGLFILLYVPARGLSRFYCFKIFQLLHIINIVFTYQAKTSVYDLLK